MMAANFFLVWDGKSPVFLANPDAKLGDPKFNTHAEALAFVTQKITQYPNGLQIIKCNPLTLATATTPTIIETPI